MSCLSCTTRVRSVAAFSRRRDESSSRARTMNRDRRSQVVPIRKSVAVRYKRGAFLAEPLMGRSAGDQFVSAFRLSMDRRAAELKSQSCESRRWREKMLTSPLTRLRLQCKRRPLFLSLSLVYELARINVALLGQQLDWLIDIYSGPERKDTRDRYLATCTVAMRRKRKYVKMKYDAQYDWTKCRKMIHFLTSHVTSKKEIKFKKEIKTCFAVFVNW